MDLQRALETLLLLSALTAACGAGAGTSDADKLARVTELYATYRSSFAEVPEVTPDELEAELAAEAVVLVDVRSPEERAISIIPGALSVEAFEARAPSLRGSIVVTYCTIGYRSGLYARRLRQTGWDARNLAGSLLAWVHHGGKLVDAQGRPTRRLHVYGARWDLAPAGWETVW